MTDPSSRAGGPVPAKICLRCGRDCAGRPRSKDARGRYLCGECAASLRTARAGPTDGVFRYDHGEGPGAGPVGAEVGVEPQKPLPASPPADTARDGSILLAEDGSIPLDADPIGLSVAITPPAVCRGCGQLMASGAVICTGCGYDTRTGGVLPGVGAPGPTCFKCGYPLRGLKAKVCPECGAATSGRERAKLVEKKAAMDAVREAYLKPVLMLAIGMAISVVGAMIGSASFSAGLWATAGYIIKYAIYVPIGVLVFLACCLIWIGFNAPMHLTALRLAGIYAVTDATALVVGLIPLPVIPLLILVTVYVGLLQDMLELDLIDAAAVGLLTFIARTVILLTVAAWVIGWLGV